MSIESLKEQARRHEQKEEWQKALHLYQQAIDKLAEEEQPDIGLYNRVGDLYVRTGDVEAAVAHYEQAMDLYLEAELPNNAIAVCKKVIRNLPDKHSIYLKMGQIRAHQGFLTDARANFLTYAERMQQEGDLDESFRALIEFADLAEEDVDVRLAVAEQMAGHDRPQEAVRQWSIAYRTLMANGRTTEADAVEARIREIDPEARVEAPARAEAEPESAFETTAVSDSEEIVAEFGEIALGGFGEEEAPEGEEEQEQQEEEAPSAADPSGFEISLGDEDEEQEEEEAAPLPTFDFGDEEEEEEEEEEAAPLPTLDLGGEEEEQEEEEAAPLPTLDFGDEEEEQEEEEAAPLPTLSLGEEEEEEEVSVLDAAAFGEADHGDREIREYVKAAEEMEEIEVSLGDIQPAEAAPTGEAEVAREGAFEEVAAEAPSEEVGVEDIVDAAVLRRRIEDAPDDVALRQRMVELAFMSGYDDRVVQAYVDLAGAMDRSGDAQKARTVYQQVLQLDPEHVQARAALGRSPASKPVREVASSEDYVDLGAMILGDDDEKSTRMVVAYQEPSGDEEADFVKMLSQFKEKVSENLDSGDVQAHCDLGTAYKEMGLLDEAVAEFQQALRASSDHLPTYELLGQTFMEMGEIEAAANTLTRALDAHYAVEDELIGIYYYLARAHEELGRKDSALEFYDRVFSLDINFADVTERLRALR